MRHNTLRANWQSLHKDELRRLQAAKLRHYLRNTILPFSPRYRRLFHQWRLTADSFQTLDDLQKIPFTSKSDVAADSRDFLIIPEQAALSRRPSSILRAILQGSAAVKRGFEREFRPLMMTSTTGRSADPVPFLFTQHDLDNLCAAGSRSLSLYGIRPDWRFINLFPFAPHLAFWQSHYAATTRGVFAVSTGGGKVLGTEGNVRLLRKIDPHALVGMPAFIYHVLQQAVEEGVRCEHLSLIILGGEKAPAGMRRKLRSLARQLGAEDVSVVATYGFTEAKLAFSECCFPQDQSTSGYHLYPDLGLFEIIDPLTGLPQPDGCPGELVYTPLDARGTVVLRYRTGDIIEGGMVYEPCPGCGGRMPRLLGSISRRSDIQEMRLDKLKGTLVDFNRLSHVLENAEHVGAWQLEIRKLHDDPLDLDELVLHVNKLDEISDESLARQLNVRFEEQTELRVNRVDFHSAQELRRLQGVGTLLKEQLVVDHRPGSRDFAHFHSATNGGSPKPCLAHTS